MSTGIAHGTAPLPPGSVIGILGGGQLGRMTALAAARLGYRTHVLCPEADGPTCQVTDRCTLSSYTDRGALAAFAERVDVVTFEFENIPVEAAAYLAELVTVRPSPHVLAVCQNRIAEKRCISEHGIATAPFAAVERVEDLAGAAARVDGPAVLKSARMGYDGKGQIRLDSLDDAAAAWRALGQVPAVLEAFIDFRRELSIIAARAVDGSVLCFPVVENRHADHILAETIAPAPDLAPELAAAAEDIARRLVEALDVTGLLAVELFETRDGRLLVNELAPRPHNSGHWTMDGCATSQFEQLVRAICGLPLGSVARHADVVMTNLLGDQVDLWPALLAEPGARLHLYGKTEARPGRKMGHVNRLSRPSAS